jgi:hypothetical protein
MFSCECDFDTLSVYARLGVTAAPHRGSNLAQTRTAFAEAPGRRISMGLGVSWDSPG